MKPSYETLALAANDLRVSALKLAYAQKKRTMPREEIEGLHKEAASRFEILKILKEAYEA